MRIKRLLFVVAWLATALSAYSQTIQDMKGTWTGKFYEVKGRDTVTADMTLVLSTIIKDQILGLFSSGNWSHSGQLGLKAQYTNREGVDVLMSDEVELTLSGGKKIKAKLGLVAATGPRGREMIVTMWPNRAEKPDPTLMMRLYNSKALGPGADSGSGKGHLIHAAAKPVYIDADVLGPFNDGYAVIHKGTADALINSKGEVVIPYNTYKFVMDFLNKSGPNRYLAGMTIDKHGFRYGYCVVEDPKTKLQGVLNKELKLVIPCIYERVSAYEGNGYLVVSKPGQIVGATVVDLSGKVVGSSNNYDQTGNGIMQGEHGKYGYGDLFRNLKISYAFDAAMPFSDGMAAVGKINEFGQMKWGYINEEGKLKIPFVFSKKPGSFNDGRALVTPAQTDEFKHAYINKQGEIVFKAMAEKGCFFDPSSVTLLTDVDARRETGAYRDGYAVWSMYCNSTPGLDATVLMDTAGNARRLIDLLKQNTWPSSISRVLTEFINREALISSSSGVSYTEVYAIADVNGKISIRTGFEEGKTVGMIYSLFDPVSQLAKVSLYEPGKKARLGYANRLGEVVILLADPSKW